MTSAFSNVIIGHAVFQPINFESVLSRPDSQHNQNGHNSRLICQNIVFLLMILLEMVFNRFVCNRELYFWKVACHFFMIVSASRWPAENFSVFSHNKIPLPLLRNRELDSSPTYARYGLNWAIPACFNEKHDLWC